MREKPQAERRTGHVERPRAVSQERAIFSRIHGVAKPEIL